MRMIAAILPLVSALALASPALAADAASEAPPPVGAPMPLLSQPLPVPPTAGQPVEETPGFQAVRPLASPEPPAASPPAASPPAAPPTAVEPSPVPAVEPAPAPAVPPAIPAPAAAAEVSPPAGVPAWMSALLIMAGALVAGLSGVGATMVLDRRRTLDRRRAVAATLALELETRHHAFDAVPVPPNADAGVSFVSAVAALGNLDGGWRAVQGSAYLLPAKLAAQLSIHYAAVHHVADFVKGQSIAAGLRMLQANRIGGHPCPDAAQMREAHVELAAAFRGVDKLVQALRAV
jgi:hypothetical protein